jgi:hypothetical protein
VKQGDNEKFVEFSRRSFSVILRRIFNRKILRHGTDGFISPPKEVVLRIFINFINPSLGAGFEPANLGSNGNHSNHCTAEDDMPQSTPESIALPENSRRISWLSISEFNSESI